MMKLIKAFIFIVILLLVFVLALVILFGPTTGELASCYDEAEANIDGLYENAKRDSWTDRKFCVEKKKVLEKLKGCSRQVQAKSKVPIIYFERVSKVLRSDLVNYDDLVEIHNHRCKEFSDLVID